MTGRNLIKWNVLKSGFLGLPAILWTIWMGCHYRTIGGQFNDGLNDLINQFGSLGGIYIGNAMFSLTILTIITIVGSLLLLCVPEPINRVVSTVDTHPLVSLLSGGTSLIVLGLISALFIHHPLGKIILLFTQPTLFITGLFGGTVICIWLGKQLFRPQAIDNFAHFWVGLYVFFLISLIPIVGGLLVFSFTLFGCGATLLTGYGTWSVSTTPISFDRLEPQSE